MADLHFEPGPGPRGRWTVSVESGEVHGGEGDDPGTLSAVINSSLTFLVDIAGSGADPGQTETQALRLGELVAARTGGVVPPPGRTGSEILYLRTGREVADVPFELCTQGDRPVGLVRPVQRLVPGAVPVARGFRELRRVLLVSARHPDPVLPWLETERLELEALFAREDVLLERWPDGEAEVDALIAQMARSDLVHLACHVIPGVEASLQLDGTAGLLLPAGRLAALERPPRMVWVNGCSSGRSGMEQIAGALAASGCPHVIGSLVPIGDGAAGVAATLFYRSLLRGADVARSMLDLRRVLAGAGELSWASLVSYGPAGRLFLESGET